VCGRASLPGVAQVSRHADLLPRVGLCDLRSAVGADNDNVIGFGFIEIPDHDFQSFADCFAHVSCLSTWQRRDDFVAAWNRALIEYYGGKALCVANDGRVTYTDPSTWRIQYSPAVQLRNQREWEAHEMDLARRRQSLECRIEAARQKAIHLGLASPADVDQVIYDLSADDFRKHFGEFHVSRAFFRRAARS
jgi:hypothetical protein